MTHLQTLLKLARMEAVHGALLLVALLCSCHLSAAQPLGANAGQPPSTTPTRLATQINEVAAASEANASIPGGFNDEMLLNFLMNTECLEAIFDSWGAFGVPLDSSLMGGGPPANGGRKADLSLEIQTIFEEVARDEAGHVRFIKEALGSRAVPCPQVDIFNAFNVWFNTAFGTMGKGLFWDPYVDDLHFLLSVWSLEEIGATGDKGITNLMQNTTLRDGVDGLHGSAAYQSAVDRLLIWERRDRVLQPWGLTVAQAVAAVSNMRNRLDGVFDDDQGIYFGGGINLVPTDGNGLTFSRTPQQVLRILTAFPNNVSNGYGGFFPNGVNGQIKVGDPVPTNFAVPVPPQTFTAPAFAPMGAPRVAPGEGPSYYITTAPAPGIGVTG